MIKIAPAASVIINGNLWCINIIIYAEKCLSGMLYRVVFGMKPTAFTQYGVEIFCIISLPFILLSLVNNFLALM